MLAMGCAEVGAAIWLMFATSRGWPVSTTQTMVASLVAVGLASQAHIDWAWSHGSVSQIVATWGVSPLVSCVLSALIFGTIKGTVLGRADPFKWPMRLFPVYLAFTGALLALFIVISASTASSLEAFGAGKAAGIVLGVFAGCLIFATVFFVPYFHRILVKGDARLRFYHLPLGPWLLKDDCPLYWPAVPSSHESEPREKVNTIAHTESQGSSDLESAQDHIPSICKQSPIPRDHFLTPTQHLTWLHPRKYWSWLEFLLQGVARDVLTPSDHLRSIHARAHRYDDRVEHLWRYCLVLAAMLMSIAHGSNDVANAVAPWGRHLRHQSCSGCGYADSYSGMVPGNCRHTDRSGVLGVWIPCGADAGKWHHADDPNTRVCGGAWSCSDGAGSFKAGIASVNDAVSNGRSDGGWR
ncbi:inorganic phosphate transporter [Aspergillus ibericus CBS 121593]|uniref:Phosphate transporter n=1 Tax=Aspergillus ibericus CBS 121593 TaxID=1448316 RepID=A0A395GYJ0_9EURO|nr:hypothetical protein BO80DRAFT_425929 [Aspergillus ibericus CBS 121593]RAL00139.1 hypothetical protein BO80DRAFT_425929 [Aspergillus ibericus CBS 121593]